MKLGFALALALPIAIASSTHAQIVLKPKGGDALPLRLKAMDSYTLIKDGVAATKMEIVFANEANARIEADFIYTLKPGSLATYFAYWFGKEKVVARVAEKERAKRIYEYITSRMRDPALIELIGKRTFRARVFPIMPHDDLRIEMHFVQALTGGTFELPLVGNDRQAFDRLNVKVDVEHTDQTADVRENIGLAKTQNGKMTTIELKGENYRPTKDLRVTVVPKTAKVRADLYAAKSGGTTGFFILNLTSSTGIAKPVVSFGGVKVSDVWPRRLPAVKAGQSILVSGRYIGTGPAKVALRDGSKLVGQTEAVFVDQREANNPASKLWASMKIEGLGNTPKARAEVVRLSQRYTIPSQYTSWIAIPEEERKRYKQEKAMAEMSMLTPHLSKAIQRHGLKSRQAQAIINQIKAIAKANDLHPEQCLQQALWQETYDVASQLASRLAAGKSSGGLESRLAALAKLTGAKPDDYLGGELQQRLYPIGQEILQRELAGKSAKALRDRLNRLAPMTRTKAQDYLAGAAQNLTYSKASQLVALEKKDPKSSKLAAMRRELNQIETKAGVPLGSAYQQAVREARQREYNEVVSKVGNYVEKGDIESPEFTTLRDRMLELGKPGHEIEWRLQRHLEAYVTSLKRGGPDSPETKAKLERIHTISKAVRLETSEGMVLAGLESAQRNLQREILLEERKTIRDPKNRQRLESELANILAVTKTPREKLVEWIQAWGFEDPNWQIRDELVRLLRDPVKNAARIRELEAELKGLDTPLRGEKWAKDRVERLQVETEIDSLQHGEPTAEQRRLLEALWARQKELRARMGDPLLQVEAPRDARQVVAAFPHGEIKPLEFNTASGRWECRFDIPTYAQEGEYVVQVYVLDSAGIRSTQTFKYNVDITPPTAKVKAERVGDKVRIEVEGSDDLARVEIAIGTTKPQPLRRIQPGRFFGLVDGGDGDAIVILTDKAHNRAEIKVAVR